MTERLEQLISALNKAGFKVKKHNPSKAYRFTRYEFTGHCLLGMIVDQDDNGPNFMSGRLVAEFAANYDLWKNCTLNYDFFNVEIDDIISYILQYSNHSITQERLAVIA